MLHFHSQTDNNHPDYSNHSVPVDLPTMIDNLLSESKLTQAQMQRLQQHFVDANLYYSKRSLKPPQSSSVRYDNYSTTIKLAFNALKYFSLFLVGTGIAFVISASLQATTVVNILISLFSQVFVPIVVVTFSIVAIAIILESFK